MMMAPALYNWIVFFLLILLWLLVLCSSNSKFVWLLLYSLSSHSTYPTVPLITIIKPEFHLASSLHTKELSPVGPKWFKSNFNFFISQRTSRRIQFMAQRNPSETLLFHSPFLQSLLSAKLNSTAFVPVTFLSDSLASPLPATYYRNWFGPSGFTPIPTNSECCLFLSDLYYKRSLAPVVRQWMEE